MKIGGNMRYLILALFITFLNVYSTDIYEGSVSGVWTVENSPYNIYGNVTVDNTELLTIEAGVEVIFKGHYYINVEGQILAQGTNENYVEFYPSDQFEGWLGIRFFDTSQENEMSEFDFCDFSYGNATVAPSGFEFRHGGAIFISNYSKVLIRNSNFSENRARSGGAIGLRNGASPTIINNFFNNNHAQGESSGWGGAIVFAIDCSPIIQNNIFKDNIASGNNYAGGGAIHFEDNCNPEIVNNLIIDNNVLCIYGSGSAIYCHSSSGYIVNNTITNNRSIYEEGITLVSTDIKIYNNIIWNNLPYSNPGLSAEIRLKNGSNVIISNNNIKNDINGIIVDKGSNIELFENNISGNPDFINMNNYSLQNNSPCIDAGYMEIPGFQLPELDILGNSRVVGSIVDMGAYENTQTLNVNNNSNIITEANLKQNYPNPFNPVTRINYELGITNYELAKIVVYNSRGQKVWFSSITDHA